MIQGLMMTQKKHGGNSVALTYFKTLNITFFFLILTNKNNTFLINNMNKF